MSNLNLFADSTIGGGQYDHVKIFGSTTVNGELKAKSMKIFGSSTFKAYCEIDDIEIFGSTTFSSLIKAQNVNIKGACNFYEDVNVANIKIFGSVNLNKKFINLKNLSIYGAVKATIVEANKVQLEGAINCDELNAEEIIVKTNDVCHIKEIVGSKILVKGKKHLFQKNKGIIYADTIEGDEIELENVEAKVIRGSKIKLGPNCKVERVEYSVELVISDQSTVITQEKVD